MKKIYLLLAICCLSIAVLAHEFWLQPLKYFYTIREVANIRFRVGENFTGINWAGNRDKVQQLWHYEPTGAINNVANKISINNGDSLQLPLQDIGTHMIVFQSTNSFIELEAKKFKEYLTEDGLDNALLFRTANGQETALGKEFYQRSVKTLIQVGDSYTDQCTKPTTLPLDIIPENNPYAIPTRIRGKDVQNVKFQVLFQGKPLENALVRTWFYDKNKQVVIETARTNQKGWISAKRHSGPFMVSCVHMEKTMGDSGADWQSFWGSLSFEYSQFYL